LPESEVFWNSAYLISSLLPRCDETAEENQTFGFLGQYWPVTLKDTNLLQHGAENT
jgi:hypothetical protein